MDTIRKKIRTVEEWYPTIRHEVEVSFILLSDNQWRVCVWGGDDFGLEKDFPHTERQSAKRLFAKIKDGTTQTQMRAWGMWRV